MKNNEKKSKQLLAGGGGGGGWGVKAVNSGEQEGKSRGAAGWEAGKALKSRHEKSKH